MIKFYTGTPGSGKSYHAAQDIYTKLRMKKNVISTMPIDVSRINNNGNKKIGIYEFMFINELTPKFLLEFAHKHHKKGKESQTVIVIDECQIIFNSREYAKKDRADWIYFFSLHRHYNFDVILITQFDRNVDRQIRSMVEIEYKHRKINNRGLFNFLPVKVFAVIEYWYVNKTKVGAHFVTYKRKVGKIYDSYETNAVIEKKLGVPAASEASVINVEPTVCAPAGVEAGDGGPRRYEGRASRWVMKGLRTANIKY